MCDFRAEWGNRKKRLWFRKKRLSWLEAGAPPLPPGRELSTVGWVVQQQFTELLDENGKFLPKWAYYLLLLGARHPSARAGNTASICSLMWKMCAGLCVTRQRELLPSCSAHALEVQPSDWLLSIISFCIQISLPKCGLTLGLVTVSYWHISCPGNPLYFQLHLGFDDT